MALRKDGSQYWELFAHILTLCKGSKGLIIRKYDLALAIWADNHWNHEISLRLLPMLHRQVVEDLTRGTNLIFVIIKKILTLATMTSYTFPVQDRTKPTVIWWAGCQQTVPDLCWAIELFIQHDTATKQFVLIYNPNQMTAICETLSLKCPEYSMMTTYREGLSFNWIRGKPWSS